jgi:ligand-binding SRPBCC domain-containing protein
MALFEYSSWIAAPVERVWAFHERADALERLSPPESHVRLIHRSGGLEAGAEVEIELRLAGIIPIRWLARHTECVRESHFVDVQVRGPFLAWTHRHGFTPERGGARLTDTVEFRAPLSPLSNPFVRLQLRAMFRYRHAMTKLECESAV